NDKACFCSCRSQYTLQRLGGSFKGLFGKIADAADELGPPLGIDACVTNCHVDDKGLVFPNHPIREHFGSGLPKLAKGWLLVGGRRVVRSRQQFCYQLPSDRWHRLQDAREHTHPLLRRCKCVRGPRQKNGTKTVDWTVRNRPTRVNLCQSSKAQRYPQEELGV